VTVRVVQRSRDARRLPSYFAVSGSDTPCVADPTRLADTGPAPPRRTRPDALTITSARAT